jgi:hypothetical protein
MTEVTNELLLETLKRMQERDARADRRLEDLFTEIRGMKEHQAGFMRTELAQDSRIAEVMARLDRIERRLELHD